MTPWLPGDFIKHVRGDRFLVLEKEYFSPTARKDFFSHQLGARVRVLYDDGKIEVSFFSVTEVLHIEARTSEFEPKAGEKETDWKIIHRLEGTKP